ncbi:MAG: LytTR family DNA-binding domain-containing protein [Oscillospiraceae bacterium]|nr:LytTR family DNA-binding domain-containing protein [Oscillospiraceae bacterium]
MNTNINIAVCDDEQQQTEYVKMLVSKWADESNIKINIEMFDSAENFKSAWGENKAFDILLLDIQMGGQNGVGLAKELRQSDTKLAIIFITGFVDYMSDGYDVSALHYLMKPVKEDKLFEVLDKAVSGLYKTARTIIFPKTGGGLKIKADDIMYAEVLSHTVMLYLTNGRDEEFQMRISDMEELLGDGFFKCHRSYVVSVKYVRRVTKTAIILENGQEIPLSRNLYDNANQMFIKNN